jgi:hypothetical protein
VLVGQGNDRAFTGLFRGGKGCVFRRSIQARIVEDWPKKPLQEGIFTGWSRRGTLYPLLKFVLESIFCPILA